MCATPLAEAPTLSAAIRRGLCGRARWLRRAILAALTTLLLGATEASPLADPVQALIDGNRLFRDGRIAEAVEAYRTGYDPAAVHPTLVYNLGTALHHLDRLPEAILWYRRADASADPWLEENLWLARRTLGSQTLPPSGTLSLLSDHAIGLRIAAVAFAWAGLALLVLLHRPKAALAVFLIAAALFFAALAGVRWGAHPAVLLDDCATIAGELPAGTEAWVRHGSGTEWQVAAESTEAVCPAEAVALVFPSHR